MAALEKLFKESYRPLDHRKVVGNYILGNILGQGRSSLVRQAVDVRDGQMVAIKTIPRTAGNKGKQRERQFRQEAELLVRVRHPLIVTLIEVLETSRHLYVVMEMIAGCTLRSVLKDRSCFTEDETRLMAQQLCSALCHLHNLDIVHRDVKPDNVMVTDAGRHIKLIDLGLSSRLAGDCIRGQCGSPVYMAPELLRALPHGPAVDMWSLGVLLHELRTGHVPFRPERSSRQATKNMAAVYAQIIRRACQDICGEISISSHGADFLRRLLQMEERNRLSSQDALKHPWLLS